MQQKNFMRKVVLKVKTKMRQMLLVKQPIQQKVRCETAEEQEETAEKE